MRETAHWFPSKPVADPAPTGPSQEGNANTHCLLAEADNSLQLWMPCSRRRPVCTGDSLASLADTELMPDTMPPEQPEDDPFFNRVYVEPRARTPPPPTEEQMQAHISTRSDWPQLTHFAPRVEEDLRHLFQLYADRARLPTSKALSVGLGMSLISQARETWSYQKSHARQWAMIRDDSQKLDGVVAAIMSRFQEDDTDDLLKW